MPSHLMAHSSGEPASRSAQSWPEAAGARLSAFVPRPGDLYGRRTAAEWRPGANAPEAVRARQDPVSLSRPTAVRHSGAQSPGDCDSPPSTVGRPHGDGVGADSARQRSAAAIPPCPRRRSRCPRRHRSPPALVSRSHSIRHHSSATQRGARHPPPSEGNTWGRCRIESRCRAQCEAAVAKTGFGVSHAKEGLRPIGGFSDCGQKEVPRARSARCLG